MPGTRFVACPSPREFREGTDRPLYRRQGDLHVRGSFSARLPSSSGPSTTGHNHPFDIAHGATSQVGEGFPHCHMGGAVGGGVGSKR